MMRIFEIDLDREKIFVQDEWLAQDELAARIRDKVDKKDFSDLSLLSEAVERLQTVLSESRSLEVRLTREVAESFTKIAQKTGEQVGAVMRKVLQAYLTTEEASQHLMDPEVAAKLAAAAAAAAEGQPAGEGLTSLADLEGGGAEDKSAEADKGKKKKKS